MRALVTRVASVCAAGLLAACGGGSTGPSAPITAFELQDASGDLINLLDDVITQDAVFRSAEDLRAGGSARFDGYLYGAVRTNQNTVYLGETIVGRTQLTTEFRAGTLEGRVDDLALIDNGSSYLNVIEDFDTRSFRPLDLDTAPTPLAGALTLFGGSIIARNEREQIQIDVVGQMTLPARLSDADSPSQFPVDGNLFGGVTREDTLIAGGDLQVENGEVAYSLETILIAD